MSGFPNRCQHLKINGTQCGSPALRRQRFCFFHKRFQDERIKLSTHARSRAAATFLLPVLEDANSIQIALMQVMRLLVSQQMDPKTARLLLYALRTASTNLRETNFKPFRHEVILDPLDVARTPLGEDIWSDRDFEEQKSPAQTAADRAIAVLEQRRFEKEEKAKWMRWAEREADRLQAEGSRERAAEAAREAAEEAADRAKAAANLERFNSATRSVASAPTPATAASVVSPVVSPPAVPPPNVLPPKKPASSLNPEKVRAELTDMIRKELPALTEVLAKARQGRT